MISEYLDYNESQSKSEAEEIKETELTSGVPNPRKYDQFVINKYSFPKGFSCGHKIKSEEEK